MPIAQMKQFADQVRAGEHTYPDRLALLESHERIVAAQMTALEQQRAKVQAKIDFYRDAVAKRSVGSRPCP
jgi:DNA-binding transcriptional MerR regulator